MQECNNNIYYLRNEFLHLLTQILILEEEFAWKAYLQALTRLIQMRNARKEYPCIDEAERERSKKRPVEEEPDWIGDAPNYDKFKGWTPEQVLVWLNID